MAVGNDTVKRVMRGVRDRMSDGAIYSIWWPGSEWDDVQAMVAPWRSKWGYNCTALFNDIFGEMNDEGYDTSPIGGTGDFNAALGVGSGRYYEEPVIEKNYPPGTFGTTPFASADVQGHLQMVYTGEDAGRNQWMMQSDTTHGVNNSVEWDGLILTIDTRCIGAGTTSTGRPG